MKRENKNRFQISCRELFRKSRVGNECERMYEFPLPGGEEKNKVRAKRETESRRIIKIGQGNVERRIEACGGRGSVCRANGLVV